MIQFENLNIDTVQRIVKGDKVPDVSQEIVLYVQQIDYASKVFKGNIQNAAVRIREKFPMISHRTAQMRVYDAIKYLHAGDESIPSRLWSLYYADKYEGLASMYASKPNLAKYAIRCILEAERCRKDAAGNDIPTELLKQRVTLVSPDAKNERLAITDKNITKAFEECLDLIDGEDIPEKEKLRLKQEVSTELGLKLEDADDGSVQD